MKKKIEFLTNNCNTKYTHICFHLPIDKILKILDSAMHFFGKFSSAKKAIESMFNVKRHLPSLGVFISRSSGGQIHSLLHNVHID